MYILVGSVTTAARLRRLLERQFGFPADVVHTPSQLSHGGCSYSVRADLRSLSAVQTAAAEYGIDIRGVYGVKTEEGKRVFYALS